jgi:acyl-CoA synthetase (NDP forming)
MSDRWSLAASSHTGALAWSAVIFKTAFKQSWIIYTSKLEDFFLWWKTFSQVESFSNISEELAIITNAGGPW